MGGKGVGVLLVEADVLSSSVRFGDPVLYKVDVFARVSLRD